MIIQGNYNNHTIRYGALDMSQYNYAGLTFLDGRPEGWLTHECIATINN
jgi:hypothetical protein